MARLEVVKANRDSPSMIFQRVCDGETLKEIARDWGLPKGRFVEWFVTEHAELYDAALRVITEDIAHEVRKLLDEVTQETMAVVKTRVDGYLKLAAKWNRQRYGEQVDVKVTVEPFAALLRRVSERKLAAARGEVVAEQVLPAPDEEAHTI